MMLIEETSVADNDLPIAEFKAHLRLGTGFADDTLQDVLLASFLRAAIAAIEARTGKILLSRSFSWTLTAWRDTAEQALPIAPVTDITEVALVASDGTETQVGPATYRLERDHHRPMLVASGQCLPRIPPGGEAEVTFVAGFAAVFGDLPADLAQAVMLLAAYFYEHRGSTGLSSDALPYGVAVLLERYKTVRILAGSARS